MILALGGIATLAATGYILSLISKVPYSGVPNKIN